MYPRTAKRPRFPRISTAAAIAVACTVIGALLGAVGYVMTRGDGATEPPAVTAAGLRVVNWNICGEAGGQRGQRGFCPNRNRPDLTVAEIGEMVAERDADAVTLQEVCGGAPGSHLALLDAALGEGWSIVRALGTRPDGAAECRGSLTGDLGVAIAVRGKVVSDTSSNTLSDEAPRSGERLSPLLCVDVEGWSHRVCTTHMLPSGDKRGAGQAERIAHRISPDGRPYILTGDFNRPSDSPELAPLTDAMVECRHLTRAEQTTHHAWDAKKRRHVYRTLDHIFAGPKAGGAASEFSSCGVDRSRMDTTPNEEDTPPNGKSDHAPLYATVRIGR
ncbi:endonuclease/exonuclease/phosphatase family protein [Streptomyces sp. NPDC058611]|uniref:endonuclease/exonuclease/phosphatase family protein n=1 Tax=unclassified Streptomyces TaxID=2593676 RepID=UPI00364D6339